MIHSVIILFKFPRSHENILRVLYDANVVCQITKSNILLTETLTCYQYLIQLKICGKSFRRVLLFKYYGNCFVHNYGSCFVRDDFSFTRIVIHL